MAAPVPFSRHAIGLGLAFLAALSPAVSSAAPPAAMGARSPALEMKLFKELAFRSIGPANMGGRISDIVAVESDPATWYVGTGTGGLFKTTNHGTTWSALFDKEDVSSIGSVALWQRNPKLVWVGTGESNSRNSSSWGKGVYKSEDAGATWKRVGLERTSNIGRIVTHPSDSNVVYVAALGRLWGENPERGVFKTSDGGRTWQHSLKVDAQTGAVDIAIDPNDPRTVYAALWARKRTPWSFSGVSDRAGIWRTRDGGSTWKRLTNGLPARTGRIGLSIYAKAPNVVLAVIESDDGGRTAAFQDDSPTGGVFRTTDGGERWERLSPWSPRGFYFSQIRVQPDDSSRVYLHGFQVTVSDDGGRTFRGGGSKNLHPDMHAMWIDPGNGKHLLLGTDGGIKQSWDRGETWSYLDNLALGQFYNVAADLREPYYRIYGGLQDNQSWGGPSRTRFEVESWLDATRAGHGIMNDHWYVLGGGDGFHVAVDPTDANTVYYESQGGHLMRQDLATGRERLLRPSHNEGEPVFRFNWNTPFLISPHDPSALWMGGQFVFKLTERGDRWQKVSPDLTTRDADRMMSGGSDAEQHCTIVSLTESPVQAGLLWAGTDDGKLWVSSDAGAKWSDLTANLRGVPKGTYVSRIEASHQDANVAYAAFDGHRTDDDRPYLLVTRDRGRSWTSISAGLPADVPVKVVRAGRRNKDLLFVGTETGVWMSLDAGKRWMKMPGLPTVPVDDLLIHPRDLDLIVGTHGRSLYVLDGIQAFEEWSPRALADSISFFTPKTAWTWHARALGHKWGQRQFAAKNPAFGAWFDYFLPQEMEDGVSFKIEDASGKLVRNLTGGSGRPGFHRVTWDLVAGEPAQRLAFNADGGQTRHVAPGRYKVVLTAGKASREQWVEVKAVTKEMGE